MELCGEFQHMLRDHATSTFNLASLRSVVTRTPFVSWLRGPSLTCERDACAGMWGLEGFQLLSFWSRLRFANAHIHFIHAEAAVLRPQFLKLRNLLWILQAKSPFAKCECSKAHSRFFLQNLRA